MSTGATSTPAAPGERRATRSTAGPWLLAAGLALVAAALAAHWAHVPGPGGARHLRPWLLVVLLVAARDASTPITVRRQTIHVSLGNSVTVLGIALLPRGDLLPVIAVAVAINQLRLRRPPVKAAFNVAVNALAAAVAAECFDAVLGGSSIRGAAAWGALVGAAITYDVVSSVLILAVMHLSAPLERRSIATFLAPLAVVPPINAALSVVAVDASQTNPWSVLFLTAFPVAAVIGHRAYTRLAGRYANLEALYSMTQRLAGLSEEHDVVREVLLGVRTALAGEHAQLVVVGPGRPVGYQLDRVGSLVIAELREVPALARLLGEDRRALLAPRGAKGDLGAALAEGGWSDAIVTRLPSAGHPRLLIVADRHDGSSFTRADLPLVQTLAAQSSVALRGTELLDELRSEVASREHDALHDALTRLGNRTLFARRCDEALARRRPTTVVAVMLLDLDGFKEINDTLGHHVGDLVLQEVARRLRIAVGGRGVPTRLGGDEFAIVFPSVGPRADIAEVARGVVEAIGQPMDVGGLALTVQASVGISLAPEHGSDTPTLLKGADVAMYGAKGAAAGIAVYDPKGDQHSTRRLVLASELRKAADAGELALHYQPKADLQTGDVLGFEALLRWRHPTFGDVSPVEFIPVAEQSGLIDGITWWVLGEALRQQRAWAAAGWDLSVAVNISARSLLDGRLAHRLTRLLAQSGVAPDRLVLEVTETSVMADAERSAAILDAAAALGVRISVDDFGTGYSSLSRLLDMPVHEIKVDRSFVTTMLSSADNMAIVTSTVQLALSMQRQVTAEGVEDDATWAALRAIGCHAAQGYVLARPMPGPRTIPWLDEQAGRAQVWSPAPRLVS